MSEAEDTLLYHVQVSGMPIPEREYRIHPVRKWRFDFAWPDNHLAVEVDGGAYSQGRHTRGRGFENDCTKINTATLLGWRVLRYTPGMIDRGEAIADIERALNRVT